MSVRKSPWFWFLFAGLLAQPGSAQEASDSTETLRLRGGSIGVPGFESQVIPALFTLAFHVTQLKAYRLGTDLVVGSIPRLIPEGVIPLGVRAGFVLPIPVGTSTHLLPTAGVGFVSALGGESLGVQPGVHVGALLMLLEADRGVRFGVTWHRLRTLEGSIWLAEFGFVRGWPRD